MIPFVLGPVALSQAGCLLPTSLENDPASKNLPPTIVAEKSTPPFAILTLTNVDRVELHITAVDPNPMDTLYARLFKPNTTGGPLRTYTGHTTTFTAETPDPNNPPPAVLQNAVFFSPGLHLCDIFPEGDLFVLVADRPFCNPPPMPDETDCKHESEVPGGLASEDHWTLVCK